MSLTEHKGVDRLERRFAALNPSPKKGTLADRALKVRGSFRKAVRAAADRKEDFASTSNGSASFRDWRGGFEFAQGLPAGTDVQYFRFEGAPGAVFFFSAQALAALDAVLAKFSKSVSELEDLAKVGEVMES
jgi:hypothetical protein